MRATGTTPANPSASTPELGATPTSIKSRGGSRRAGSAEGALDDCAGVPSLGGRFLEAAGAGEAAWAALEALSSHCSLFRA